LLRLSARDAERSAGVSAAQLFVLHQLRDRGGLSLGELAASTFTDPSSVSVVVTRLVERGFVERVRSAADGRRVELALTPTGRRTLKKAPDPAQDRFVAAVRAIAPAKRRILSGLLRDLVMQLGVDGAPELFFEDGTSSHASSKPTVRKEARRGSR
jgi:DNA-binding MarR family transcriptional regulator